MRSAPSPTRTDIGTRPRGVTAQNWAVRRKEGFEWSENLVWPLSTVPQVVSGGKTVQSDASRIRFLQLLHGHDVIKLGDPLGFNDLPNASFTSTDGDQLVGVYVKRSDTRAVL